MGTARAKSRSSWPLLALFAIMAMGNAARLVQRDGTLGGAGMLSVGVGVVMLVFAGLAWFGSEKPRGG